MRAGPGAHPCRSAQAFGAILQLVPRAESVVKLNAVCMECFQEAAYTRRLGLEKEVAARVSGGRGGRGRCWVLCPLRPGLRAPRSR